MLVNDEEGGIQHRGLTKQLGNIGRNVKESVSVYSDYLFSPGPSQYVESFSKTLYYIASFHSTD